MYDRITVLYCSTGWLCYSSHSTTLLLPHYIHVDVNGGSSVVYCIGESVYKSRLEILHRVYTIMLW